MCCRARVFDPIISMEAGVGPMNLIPAFAQARGKAAFSERNPYPGMDGSAPLRWATSRIFSMLR